MNHQFEKDPMGPVPQSSATPVIVIVLVVLGVIGLIGVAGICILSALLMPAVSSARGAAQRMQCTNNMKEIALAMHNYADAYGSFPPAYVADENGKPMHSWRVLILEFSDPGLFNQYDMSEPWDSPANQAVLAQKPNYMGCPSGPNGDETSYMLVTGPNTLYPQGDKGPRFRDIIDGTSRTILLVEVNNSGVAWTEPIDLSIDEVSIPINTAQPSSNHQGGAIFAYADGSVRFIHEGEESDLLEQIDPRDGN